MLAEVTITMLGRGTHMSCDLARILKIVDESSLPYCLTPSGTCIEGEWEQVMQLVKRCHQEARKSSCHVRTTIRIEDEEGAKDKLTENITSVERVLGHSLNRHVVAC
jgi:uncharacterized protein (TIGR00106 family)